MAPATKYRLLTRILLIIIGLGGIIAPSSGQSNQPYSIQAKGFYDAQERKIILRWAPLNFTTWQWANQNGGYRIERTTISSGGTPLSPEDMLSSRVTLAEGIEPLPESGWEALATAGDPPGGSEPGGATGEPTAGGDEPSDLAGIVAGCIYGDSLDVVNLTNSDFMTVMNTNLARDNRFAFSLFACDQKLSIALAAGLAYVDEGISEAAEYIYTINLRTSPQNVTVKKGTAIVSTYVGSELPAPGKPKAMAGDSAAIINWEKKDLVEYYSSYIIERSEDNGASFLKLNASPFISLNQVDEGKELNSYLDSLPGNSIEYVYRVAGISPFGIQGPYSDTVHVIGKAAPIAAVPYIHSINEVSTGELTVGWQFPANMESKVANFELYRSEEIDGKYVFVANAIPSLRVITDATPLSANYYIVKVKDTHGNYVSSLPKLGQAKDETPPAAPGGLSGSCDPSGMMIIHWAHNTEADLGGYRVYMSDQNVVDSGFVQVTNQVVLDTVFTLQVELHTLTEQMFFSVKAVDFRDNLSAPSAYLDIHRVDIIPPSPPAITKVTPKPASVKLDVSLSSSLDIVKYEFQKREENSPIWESLGEFTVANMVMTFTDSITYVKLPSRRRWYQYRLLAYDDANLVSSSDLIRAKPLDQGIRSSIQSLTATYIQTPPKTVHLQWQ